MIADHGGGGGGQVAEQLETNNSAAEAFFVNAPAQLVSITPSAGSGLSATFTLVLRDANGAEDIDAAQWLLNGVLEAAGSCQILYERAVNRLRLKDDAGVAWSAPITLGSGMLQNSRCSIDGAGVSVELVADELRLTFPVVFAPGLGAVQSMWAAASDGTWSPWTNLGSWTQPGEPNQGPHAVSLSPSAGSGSAGIFTATFSDPDGAGDLAIARILIHDVIASAGGCFLRYSPSLDRLYLLNDAATSWGNGVAPGAATTIENGACRVDVAGATVSQSGTDLTMTLPISFLAAFAGAKTVYTSAFDKVGGATGWQALGSWTVDDSPQPLSVSPSAGSGLNQTFTAKFADPNGGTDITSAHMLFNTNLSAPNGCYAQYIAATNRFHLLNDAATSFGAGAVAGSATTLANSQCRLNVSGAGATTNGNELTVTLPVEFLSGFGGVKKIFAAAIDLAGNNSGWVEKGSWTVGDPSQAALRTAPDAVEKAVVAISVGRTFAKSDESDAGRGLIAARPRSADWIAAEYNNQNSPAGFVNLGPEQTP